MPDVLRTEPEGVEAGKSDTRTLQQSHSLLGRRFTTQEIVDRIMYQATPSLENLPNLFAGLVFPLEKYVDTG